MPTIHPPANNTSKPIPEKTQAVTTQQPVQQTPPPPPKPLSPAAQVKQTDTKVTTEKRSTLPLLIAIILAILILCGILGSLLYGVVKTSVDSSAKAPVLNTLPAYTKETTIVLSGTAAPQTKIVVTANTDTVNTTSDANGTFQVSYAFKSEGKVSFSAVAQSNVLFIKKESPVSNTVFTTYDRTGPNIQIVTPPKSVNKQTYTLKGTLSEPGKLTVSVNGKAITVTPNSDLSFSAKLDFVKGENTVVVVAQDVAGNETTTTPMKTTYTAAATQKSTQKAKKSGNLPNSAGNLTDALNSLYTRYIAIGATVLVALGFGASSSVVWLVKKKNSLV